MVAVVEKLEILSAILHYTPFRIIFNIAFHGEKANLNCQSDSGLANIFTSF